jgi:hypothetical protein
LKVTGGVPDDFKSYVNDQFTEHQVSEADISGWAFAILLFLELG